MAVPWTAPLEGQGVYPAQAPFFIPKPVDPEILALIQRQRAQQQEQISGTIQDAISAVGKYMEQRKQDEIANQLMAGMNAPRATAVPQPVPQPATPQDYGRPSGDSPQAYQRDYGMTASVPITMPLRGTPSSTLSPAEIAQNTALGYSTIPGKTPDLGGVFGFQLRQQAAKNQYDQLYDQARIQHLNYLMGGGAGGPGSRPSYDYTDPRTGQTIKVTGNKFADLTKGPRQYKPTADPWADLIPIARGKLDEKGQFTNAYSEAASGDYVKLATPKGYTQVVPYDEYVKHKQAASIQASPAGGINVTMPQVGEVRRGYRFTGGDPADRDNWEPQ